MNCEICGRELVGRQKHVCSSRCRYLREKRKRPMLKCPVCGREFRMTPRRTKYCRAKCRKEAQDGVLDSFEQICWTCENATGGCEWSRSLDPVPGWTAEKLSSFGEAAVGKPRYRIFKCPKYRFG